MKRKLISLLLVLAMCLSILPMQVFASETTGTDVQASEETSPMLQVDPAVITVEKASAGSPEGEMASNLFDGNIKDTKWCITNDTGWVAFATGVPIRLSQMKGYFAKQSNNHVDKDYPNVKGYKLQAFDGDGKPADADYEDASKWKDIGVVTDNTASTLVTPLTMTKPARYFRLEVTDPGSNAKNAIRFYELELFSSFLEPVQVKFAPGSIEGAKITGTMAPVQAYQGSGYVLPRCEFTCDNVEYVFSGWKAGDSAEIHAPESNMLITGPVTLTAQWIKSDSVRFEAGTPAENVAAAGKMAAVAVLKGQKYTLPDCDFQAEGYLFNGWKMGSDPEIKQPGTIITISDSVILTAQWHALVDGYYPLQDAQDFQMFAAIVARGQNDLKAKLMADITLDNAASRIGTKGHPFIGEFDGNGHTVTVSRIVDRENCGGVFDYVNGGARIHDLQVAGSMQTTEKFTGGLIGRIMNKEPNAPTVFLERCSVAVALTTDLSGDNTVGGIFGLDEQSSGNTAEIIMTDVLFTGKLVTNSGGSHIGGFGGFQKSTNNTLQNCLMAGDLSNAGAEESDAVIRNGNKGVNCYYLPSGSITTSQAEKVTAKALASGEIAYRLGTGTRTGKNPWRQNLTGEHIDPVPTLDSTHAKVLKITFAVVNGTMDSAETTLYVNPGKLTADQIPTDMKPNAAYETGSWNMDPATTELTEDTTFTYTFGNKWATDVAHTAEGVQMTINEKLTNATVVAAIYDGERLIAAAAKTVETLEAGGQLLVELPANDQSTILKLFVMDEHHAPIHAAQKLEKQ